MSTEPEPVRRASTYDGSLWGPDVCRCGGHVDPHRHTEADPYGKSIYDEDDGCPCADGIASDKCSPRGCAGSSRLTSGDTP